MPAPLSGPRALVNMPLEEWRVGTTLFVDGGMTLYPRFL